MLFLVVLLVFVNCWLVFFINLNIVLGFQSFLKLLNICFLIQFTAKFFIMWVKKNVCFADPTSSGLRDFSFLPTPSWASLQSCGLQTFELTPYLPLSFNHRLYMLCLCYGCVIRLCTHLGSFFPKRMPTSSFLFLVMFLLPFKLNLSLFLDNTQLCSKIIRHSALRHHSWCWGILYDARHWTQLSCVQGKGTTTCLYYLCSGSHFF